jgi:hypothetical protein
MPPGRMCHARPGRVLRSADVLAVLQHPPVGEAECTIVRARIRSVDKTRRSRTNGGATMRRVLITCMIVTVISARRKQGRS